MAELESRTLGGMLDEIAERYARREAIVFQEHRLTYGEFLEEVDDLAKSLLQVGIGKGSRVAVLMSNRPEWLLWYFAATKVGAILVAVNTWYKEEELTYVLRHSDASLLAMMDRFASNDYLDMLQCICPEIDNAPFGEVFSERLPFLRHVVCVGSRVPHAAMGLEDFLAVGREVPGGVLRAAQESVTPEDTACIIYTSGTTAFPKGVMLCHRSVVQNGFNIGERQRLEETDRAWLPYPLFFSAGCCNVLIATLTHGACLILQERFDASEALRLFRKEGVTVYHGLPNMTLEILNHPDLKQGGELLLAKGEGGPVDRVIVELGVERLVNMYGLTESATAATCTDADDPLEIRLNTEGVPLPGVQVKIADPDTGRVLPSCEHGEICLKGYSITQGYYKDPEMTAARFDAGGFFHTGDLGWLDERGYLHYEGRLGEMIKTGGINVSPAEVEEVLNGHAKIREAHVVGIPDEAKGELVVAFVGLHEAENATEEELLHYCRERMASYKVPERVHFRTAAEFPRTASGKVLKRSLIEEAGRPRE